MNSMDNTMPERIKLRRIERKVSKLIHHTRTASKTLKTANKRQLFQPLKNIALPEKCYKIAIFRLSSALTLVSRENGDVIVFRGLQNRMKTRHSENGSFIITKKPQNRMNTGMKKYIVTIMRHTLCLVKWLSSALTQGFQPDGIEAMNYE